MILHSAAARGSEMGSEPGRFSVSEVQASPCVFADV